MFEKERVVAKSVISISGSRDEPLRRQRSYTAEYRVVTDGRVRVISTAASGCVVTKDYFFEGRRLLQVPVSRSDSCSPEESREVDASIANGDEFELSYALRVPGLR